MSGAVVKKVVPAGRELIIATRALETHGHDRNQWRNPGPNSSWIMEPGFADLPVDTTPAAIVSYTVPDGMIFSLRSFIVNYFGANWTQGTTQILFTLRVTGVGPRTVDNLRNLRMNYGSTVQGPWPVGARVEFEPGETLTWEVVQDGTVLPSENNIAFAQIDGFLYPQSERVI